MLRRLDAEAPLLIVTNDGGEFYSKPMLSEAFTAGKTPETIANNTAEQMAAQLKAIVRAHALVTAIEPDAKRVRMGDEALDYSKLVLALGAGQIPLPATGAAAKRLLTVNNLEDYALFRGTLTGRKSVAIIGAGLIGCEFANDLCSAGFKVDLIDIADQPLPRLLPPVAAAMLRERLAVAGVNWHLGSGVKALDHNGNAIEITLDNGTVLTAEVVLS